MSFPFHPELGETQFTATPSTQGASYSVVGSITAPYPVDVLKIRTATTDALCVQQLSIDGTSSGVVVAQPHVTGTKTGAPTWMDAPCTSDVYADGIQCSSDDTFFLFDYVLPPMTTGDVVIHTCDLSDAGSIGNFPVFFPEYPWMGTNEFTTDATTRDTTYTVISNLLLPTDFAAVRFGSRSDKLCIDSITVGGKVAQTGFPVWLDSNCGSVVQSGIPCIEDQTFSFSTPAPVISAVVDMQIKTCPGSASVSAVPDFTVSFPSNTGFNSFTFDTAPVASSTLFTVASGVTVPWPMSTVLITADSEDAVCIEELYINGVENMKGNSIRPQASFIDAACTQVTYDGGSLGNLPCRQDSELFVFTEREQPAPTTVPTAVPTASPTLAPIVVESEHPYVKWNYQRWLVSIPGATCYMLNMDPQSWTPDRYNSVRIFGVRGDGVRQQYPGNTKKRLYKKRLADFVNVRVDNVESVEIKHRANGADTAWGFRLTITECLN